MWNAWVQAMYASGMRLLNVEPDLDCIYTQSAACLDLYSSAFSTARALGMSISINPEFSGPITSDCTTIIGHVINSGAGGGGAYAPGVSDWFTCLTDPIAGLGGLSIYQWMVVHWLQNGDTLVVLHEPTTMAARWGEGIVPSVGCNNTGTGNTCPQDWVSNFLYGGGTGAGGA